MSEVEIQSNAPNVGATEGVGGASPGASTSPAIGFTVSDLLNAITIVRKIAQMNANNRNRITRARAQAVIETLDNIDINELYSTLVDHITQKLQKRRVRVFRVLFYKKVIYHYDSYEAYAILLRKRNKKWEVDRAGILSAWGSPFDIWI